MSDLISRDAVINITAETGALETQIRVKRLPSAEVYIKQNAIEAVAENLGKMYGVEASEMMEQARQWIEG